MPISVESILYGDYIKYDRLFMLTKHAFYGSPDPGAFIDIFIDMNSMLKPLYRWFTNENVHDIVFDKDNVITSSMLNLVAHLKHYFITRHHVYARCFIVYGDNFPVHPRAIYPSYNQSAYSEYATKIQITDRINEAIDVMSILVPYLEDVYFIYDREVETGVLIKAIMEYNALSNQEYSKMPKIVYSKDPYCYQLVAMEPYTFLYRPKKAGQEDASWVVPKSQLYESYALGEAKYSIEPETPIIGVESFSLILSMSGLRCRNIKGVMRFSKAVKTIQKAFDSLFILPGYNVAFDLGLDQIIPEGDKKQENIFTISQNFKAIDLWYNYNMYAMEKGISGIQRFMVNLYDPEAIKDINDKYFRNNPIDIMAL